MTPPLIVTTINDLRTELDAARASGATVGFVPTMGYLHDGHASLMRAARPQCDVLLASIFVNPLQFGADEDLSDYPRDLDRDLDICATAGVDLVFVPTVDEMYPRPMATVVAVDELAGRWEGATRPTHFAGVSTVVTKLLSIVGACQAFFGEKDYQQLQIIRRLVADLSLPVTVVGCPIRREPDGLAMSSRNVYLDADERVAARVLSTALSQAAAAFHAGTVSGPELAQLMSDVVDAEPLAELDYAAVVDPVTLDEVERADGTSRLIIAAQVGRPRLLDNRGLDRSPEGSPS